MLRNEYVKQMPHQMHTRTRGQLLAVGRKAGYTVRDTRTWRSACCHLERLGRVFVAQA